MTRKIGMNVMKLNTTFSGVLWLEHMYKTLINKHIKTWIHPAPIMSII